MEHGCLKKKKKKIVAYNTRADGSDEPNRIGDKVPFRRICKYTLQEESAGFFERASNNRRLTK